MKKFLSILIALFLFTSVSYSYTKEELSFATEILFRKTAYLDQMKFKQETMAELAYLKRVYKLDSFNLQTKKYISNLNDFYYKAFYPYSKLLDENAVITEDCIDEQKTAQVKKLLFYTIYPGPVTPLYGQSCSFLSGYLTSL